MLTRVWLKPLPEKETSNERQFEAASGRGEDRPTATAKRAPAHKSRSATSAENLICRYCGSDDLASSFKKRRATLRVWFLGEQTRNKGSVHSDIWVGTAADLAERGVIGIYPVSGWWKDQPNVTAVILVLAMPWWSASKPMPRM